MSYNLGSEYGYDQINVNPTDFRDFLTTDVNQLHDINKIDERERRLLKKINTFQPTCQENYNRNTMNYCRPNLFSKNGSYIEQNRMNMRKNIEDYYYSGMDHKIKNCSPSIFSKTHDKKKITEGFNNDDLQVLQNELNDIEKKNNMLMLFVFFLVLVIIIQYSKINNEHNPIKLMILPSGTPSAPMTPFGTPSAPMAPFGTLPTPSAPSTLPTPSAPSTLPTPSAPPL
jgi:hypothetical protein